MNARVTRAEATGPTPMEALENLLASLRMHCGEDGQPDIHVGYGSSFSIDCLHLSMGGVHTWRAEWRDDR